VLEAMANQPLRKVRPIRPAASRPFGIAVGSNLDFPTDLDRRLLGPVAMAIDDVHGDGRLQRVRVGLEDIGLRDEGMYDDGDHRISISPATLYPRLVMIHEIGHLLDARAFEGMIGTAVRLASRTLASFAEWRSITSTSRLVTLYVQTITDLQRQIANGSSTEDQVLAVRYPEYLVEPEELWARAYLQDIVVHSTDDGLVEEWRRYRSEDADSDLPEQWDDIDFEPIARSMDRVFAREGWRR
jgi:hypothetical protein